jgi:TM2 domain-containing membrane protein YozV
MYCSKCGKEMAEDAAFCPHCGAPSKVVHVHTQLTRKYTGPDISEKLLLPALLLCLFLGGLGIHRFYVGKIGTGILWLLTGWLLGIGTLIDLIMIIVGSFKDSEGKTLKNWT